MAAICTALTIAFAWIADHPDKVMGSIITLVVFGIIAGVVKFRGESSDHSTKWTRRRRTGSPPTER